MLDTTVDKAYSTITATAYFTVLFTIGTFFPLLRQFIFILKNTDGHVDFRTLCSLPSISINFSCLTNIWQFCNISGFSQETSKTRHRSYSSAASASSDVTSIVTCNLLFHITAVQNIVRTCTYSSTLI
jgi:hypothetical protein